MPSKYRKVLVIPDTQVKPGVDTRHLTAISNYIEEKRPDTIVHLGDHYDLPSLSTYSLAGEKEGKRYSDDIQAGRDGMAKLTAFRGKSKSYRPQMHFVTGNHETRILRTIDANPTLIGSIGMKDMQIESYGWKVHPFLQVFEQDGFEYAHFFSSGVMGRPVTSAAAMLRERQGSCVQGHVQKVDIAIHPRTQKMAIMAGIAYTHSEDFLGPQGNATKRQIVVLHEVRDGRADPMFVSLDYLLRNWL